MAAGRVAVAMAVVRAAVAMAVGMEVARAVVARAEVARVAEKVVARAVVARVAEKVVAEKVVARVVPWEVGCNRNHDLHRNKSDNFVETNKSQSCNTGLVRLCHNADTRWD